jgi:hypothetical protein
MGQRSSAHESGNHQGEAVESVSGAMPRASRLAQSPLKWVPGPKMTASHGCRDEEVPKETEM